MKYLLLLIAALSINQSLFAQQSNYLYANFLPGCIARWTFNGNANQLIDSSGTGNNGTLTNTISAPGWRNVPHEGVKFNGYNSKGNVPNSPTLQLVNGTIVALVKFDGFYTGTCQGNNILSKGMDFTTGNYYFRTTDNEYDTDCYAVNSHKQMIQAYFYNIANSPNPNKPVVEIGKWYFFAVTYVHGVSHKLYHVEMDTNFYNPPLAPLEEVFSTGVNLGVNNNDLNIGYLNAPAYPYSFNGIMDELVIFNRALNDKEIISVYDFLWKKNMNDTNTVSIAKPKLNDVLRYRAIDDKYLFEVKDNTIFNAVLSDMSGRVLKNLTIQNGTILDLNQYAKQVFILNVYNQHSKASYKLIN